MKRAPSLTWRLAALFAGANALLVALLGLAVHVASDRHFVEQDLHDLHGRALLVSNRIAQLESAGRVADLAAGPAVDLSPVAEVLAGHHRMGSDEEAVEALSPVAGVLAGHHALAARIVAPSGAVRFALNGEVAAALPPAPEEGGVVTFGFAGSLWRGIELPLPPHGEPGPAALRLKIAVNIDHHAEFLSMLRRALLAAGIALSLAGVGLGWLAARRGLAPLAGMARGAADISASELSKRLDASALPREIRPLADELNAMLSRLDDAFRRLAEFSSDIAHELRTPVSNLMMETEVALSRARDAATYRTTLESNLEEFGRLTRMVGDMLFLAKADHGLVVPRRETIDLAAEADALIEFYDALAADRQIRLVREGGARTSGDRLMIRRALSNLLSNALAHAPAGSTVRIGVTEHADGATLDVDNAGEAIPAEVLPRLFERFYRADPSRAGSADGAGLGLAIVRSIAAAHGGTVAALRAGKVNRFRIELPHSARDFAAPGLESRKETL